MRLPKGLSIAEVVQAAEADEGLGFCLHCGAESGSVEPDARGYECEVCGEAQVFGAEELVLMLDC